MTVGGVDTYYDYDEHQWKFRRLGGGPVRRTPACPTPPTTATADHLNTHATADTLNTHATAGTLNTHATADTPSTHATADVLSTHATADTLSRDAHHAPATPPNRAPNSRTADRDRTAQLADG
ncbi:hypothetical protein [Kribbella hippodromi]